MPSNQIMLGKLGVHVLLRRSKKPSIQTLAENGHILHIRHLDCRHTNELYRTLITSTPTIPLATLPFLHLNPLYHKLLGKVQVISKPLASNDTINIQTRSTIGNRRIEAEAPDGNA